MRCRKAGRAVDASSGPISWLVRVVAALGKCVHALVGLILTRNTLRASSVARGTIGDRGKCVAIRARAAHDTRRGTRRAAVVAA